MGQLERNLERALDRKLQDLPREPGKNRLLMKPSRGLRTLWRFNEVFSRAQAKAIKDCLRELAKRGVAKRAAGWARGIAGPSDDPVGYGWERILVAAHNFKADIELEVTPEVKGGVARFRRRPKLRLSRELRSLIREYEHDSALVNSIPALVNSIRREYGPGRPHKPIDHYVAEVCDVYKRVSGKPPRPGKRMSNPLVRLLHGCLAPELFFEKGRPMKVSAIYDAVRRTQRMPQIAHFSAPV